MPHVAEVHIDSELFLVLFIAPLLFNEACESSKRELWNSLPSIPPAAAFACAATLGSTDAAAVTGAFSAADAGVTFLVLFFGGILAVVAAGGASHAARTLIEEHRSIEQTLQERVGYSDEQPGVGAGKMLDPSTCVLSEQFRLSREYIEMVTAGALSVELDKIGELQGRGKIDEDIAQQLRQNVYVLQMNAEAE